ncbi:Eco57I restriction-modification methylase domain-containing protein [Sphaerospermopsis sp. FACHB-1094]|uniref:Eco57I restriction-modification methylase domain-containing protein n=1 Tax=Sphaerospermopsis sp. FACHB-1094 TaxID=2692861 RepID=UPI001684BC45|nr:TaqI-like C-terminal specificity domain-containing protein [Sphaerospermopsis sp. FACHB-1094]MBD2134349.1 Eco57I restriction-modification methylase domain-containing protein [Sphaerospermopsis sp. FACHB-1094]
MTDTQKPNKPLFSQHYLRFRIQQLPEWQLDITSEFEQLNKIYLAKKAILPTLNESQTEEEFIKPVLEILGFKYITQVVTRGKGRSQRPDYALFSNTETRDIAYTLQSNETAFYSQVLAIAEAKYWERQLSKVSANDKRDIFKNENPSFQISSYLTGTNVDWGILTNGREWRLYYRLASSTATEFYPIDLVELLESEDVDNKLEDKLEKFKYFWLFFRRAAFEKDSYNKNFLERVREGSTTYATQVGNELKTLVFEQIFPELAGGFVADATRRGKTIQEKQVYAATLSFLYKLLFLLYAEARNLLPITTAYRDYSLIKITQEIAESLDKQKTLSQTSTKIYKGILSLFEIVDRGDAALEVPRYNGGLFHFDFHENQDIKDYPDNHFLYEHQLSDAVLAPALDKLARFEKLPIDYSFLGVRQLGSIYEGLLEYRVVVEDGNTGKVHLENDKGERKATGSYYTPDYIVKYIVSHTLKPSLEERKQQFADLMTQINQIQENLKDGRLGVQSRNGLQKDLQRLERTAQNTLLDIKICDPAMGSGHFLVEAVDLLTDELIAILNEYPEHNPVLEMLEITRNSILENLQNQGITIDVNKLEDTQLLQRVVMKRCIYGVDLNPMAVELAKVSLWLHSFTIGAPLSFLDHHLRCGNSLIGTTAKEAEAKMQQEESGQLSLLTGPFVGLLRAAEIMRGVSTLSDATFAEVETSERLFKEFDQAAKPYKRLLDVYVSQFFGVKQAKNWLERWGTNAIYMNVENLKDADFAVYEDARRLFEEKRVFHWDLEFPEVFIDLENASWKYNSGFDAVIGNPPYGVIDKEYTSANQEYISNTVISKDIYLFFIEMSLKISCKSGNFGLITPNTWMTLESGYDFRKLMLQTTKLMNIAEFRSAFQDAIVETAAFIASNKINYDENTEVVNFANEKIISRYFRSASEWLLNEEYVIDYYLNSSEINILKKSNNQCIKLGELVNICGGTKLYQKGKGNPPQTQLVVKEKPYTSNKLLPDFEPIITGGNIQRYVTQNELTYVKYGVWLAEPRNENIFRNQKIIVRRTDDSIIASIDSDQRICQNSVHCIIKKDDSDYSDYFLLAVLNSFYIKWWYQKKNFQMVGKPFAEVKVIYVSRIPIPKISFTTPPETRQEHLQNLINLYQQYQNNQNADILLTHIILHLSSSKELVIVCLYPLLIQIGLHQLGSLLLQNFHHIHQQPSEADVIHDFLAYLAEQMIELNQQKQTETKGFIKWLERFIGTDIDNLTNKSKIQNYLGDYYKQKQGDNHLTLDELIDILKKNKKKIKIDITTRKEQETLGKEYESSLNVLLPIKQQLKQCDWLIDEIVYKLYGLTEEEKAIIEGENR